MYSCIGLVYFDGNAATGGFIEKLAQWTPKLWTKVTQSHTRFYSNVDFEHT